MFSHCVWLHRRFPLGFREVEESVLQRGVIVSYETVRRWCAKCGQAYPNGLRRHRPRTGGKWHLNEVFIRINGGLEYLWRVAGQDGNVLGILGRADGTRPLAGRDVEHLLQRYGSLVRRGPSSPATPSPVQ
ncbi:hypothetical protein [Streptomyces sp. TG1A-8]|uniref:hypothetical protein n=1 Tax=Streptomyces sp. TG1A-8 TaxID=3051385 RepID=UPI0034645613